MKKFIAIFLAIIMMTGILASCSSKKNNNISEIKPSTDEGKKTDVVDKTDGSTGAGIVTTTDYNFTPYALKDMTVYPSDDAVLKWTYTGKISGFTQLGHQSFPDYMTQSLFFEGLFGWDAANNTVYPWLCESYEQIDDLTTRIHLTQKAYSNLGDPLVASDVLFTLKFLEESGRVASYISIFNLDACKVIDDYTIDLVTYDPYPWVTLELAGKVFSIAVEKSARTVAYDEATGTWDQEALDFNPVYGTGPYRLVETDKLSYATAERVDNYWAGFLPYYKRVEIICSSDSQAAFMGIEAGDYDYTFNCSATQAIAAEQSPETFKTWYQQTAGNSECLYMNSEFAPLADKAVRQAIALALDYDALVKVALDGLAEPGDNALLPMASNLYSAPDGKDDYNKFDLEAAKKKMAESGYPDGFEVELIYTASIPANAKLAEMVKPMLKELGIEVSLAPQESAVYNTRVQSGDYQFAIAQNTNANPLNSLYHFDPNMSYAIRGWCGADWYDGDKAYLDDLIDKCYHTIDAQEQMKYWTEMTEIIREYVPAIGLVYHYMIRISNPKLVSNNMDSAANPYFAWYYEESYITGK